MGGGGVGIGDVMGGDDGGRIGDNGGGLGGDSVEDGDGRGDGGGRDEGPASFPPRGLRAILSESKSSKDNNVMLASWTRASVHSILA